MKKITRVKIKLLVLCAAAVLGLTAQGKEVKAAGETKIHFISLNSTTDAILLESNGHFGMVDSGEDWDYPDGVTYPLRDGVTQGIGYEQQVIHYLKSVGVEKLDFYIATHSHSDHIGSGDEILDAFPTDRLYINRYDDSYMLDAHGADPSDPYYYESADESKLWDNQYVYDQIIEAAQRNGTQIITDLDLEESASYRSFTMGDMSIQLMNLERDRDEAGNIIPVSSENNNCIVTKITAFGRVALLTSDMEPLDGDTAKIAQQLIAELGEHEEVQTSENIDIELDESYEEQNYNVNNNIELDIPENRIITKEQENDIIDETQKNEGKTISIDLMKMIHHSVDYNNTTYFLTSLNPKTAVITGFESWFTARERDCLPNTEIFATATDSAAVVATFSEDGIDTEYCKIDPEWYGINGVWYYFDSNGRTFADQGAYEIDGKIYCFDQKGTVATENRWVQVDGKWRYWLTSAEFFHSDWLEENGNWYYLDQSGDAATGWKEIRGNWFYFYDNCALATDTWIDNYYVNEMGAWVPGASKDEWILSGSRWWYRHADDSYTVSGWELINDSWYYFDEAGWMVTGWQWVGDKCYYLTSSGAMAADTWIGDYYVDASGAWVPGAVKDGWLLSGNRWWYRHADGSYTVSDWEQINGSMYYFDSAGWMVTGWQWIDDKCYYLTESGALATDTWIGSYYVDENGVWIQEAARDEWILSGNRWWYRHADGGYTTSDWEQINGKWYYFDEAGWMLAGWIKLKEDWYYLDSSGAMVANAWVGNYYLKSDGRMAVSEWVQNGMYYVDENGNWIP